MHVVQEEEEEKYIKDVDDFHDEYDDSSDADSSGSYKERDGAQWIKKKPRQTAMNSYKCLTSILGRFPLWCHHTTISH